MQYRPMQYRSFYHGWLIELSEQPQGYSFQCWLPDEQLGLGDRVFYPTIATALAAAQSRADLEAVKLALEHCYRTFQRGDLEDGEYRVLADLIMRIDLSPGSPVCE